MKFEEYSILLSGPCKLCNGKRYIEKDNQQEICKCQLRALIHYRHDQLPVDLRYKEWGDYTGDNVKKSKEIKVRNWEKCRCLAFAYCFSKESISEINDCNISLGSIQQILKKRISKSKIIKRKKEGANIAFFGDDDTGKTLLAALVAKEIIYASVLLGDLDFKWLPFSTLINALNFDRPNYSLIDEVSCVDFLVLDNVYVPQQGNYMKNFLDELFHDRRTKRLPIILTGTHAVADSNAKTKTRGDLLLDSRQAVGDEFYRLLNSENTQKINLQKEKIVTDDVEGDG